MKITEEDMVQANEPMVPEQPVAPEQPSEPVVAEKPEVTPELIDSLIADMPELADCDKEMLIKGITIELEHFDAVGGDIKLVARIACDHIKEFPGKDYYAALAQMEQALAETPEEEQAPVEEIPAEEEVATETPRDESQFESKVKEEKKEPEAVEAKKDSNKKQEDIINKKAVEKK